MVDATGKPVESVVFSRVLYVPLLQNNLFSVLSCARTEGMNVNVTGAGMKFVKNGKTIFTATVRRNVASLDGTTLENTEQALATHVSLETLYRRLGHIGKDQLKTLINNDLAHNILVDNKTTTLDVCEHCLAGKQHRDPFPHLSDNRATSVLERIHSDLHGPLPQTKSGYKYWVTFVDNYSRYKQVYLLKKKSDAFDVFKEYVAYAERKQGVLVKELQDDKGGEYMGKDFTQYCVERGISRQHTVRATPQQNGVAERLNRTLAEGVTAMLNQANLPASLWGEALNYLTIILNATPSSSLSNTTSFEVWEKRKPDFLRFQIFSCRAYIHIPKADRKAFQTHTQKCIFFRFQKGYKGWRCYNSVSQKTILSRDVIFDESSFPGLAHKDDLTEKMSVRIRDLWPEDDTIADVSKCVGGQRNDQTMQSGGDDDDDDNDDDDNDDDDTSGPHLPTRIPLPPSPPMLYTPSGSPIASSWPPRPQPPTVPPVATPQINDFPPLTLSPSWEEGRNETGKMLTQLTPPQYSMPFPDPPSLTTQRHGNRPQTPPSPTPARPLSVSYATIVRTPPSSRPPSPPPVAGPFRPTQLPARDGDEYRGDSRGILAFVGIWVRGTYIREC